MAPSETSPECPAVAVLPGIVAVALPLLRSPKKAN